MGEARRRREVTDNGSRADNRPSLRAPDEETRPVSIDHEERARLRLAELRGALDDDTAQVFQDKFYAEAPPGWTYEWKLHSAFNKEYPQYLAGMMRHGWSPVPSSRVRHLLYPEYEGENCIVDGLILMERPKELTERRRERDYQNAVQQVKSKVESAKEAPPGTAPRGPGAHPDLPARIKTHIGPMAVPE